MIPRRRVTQQPRKMEFKSPTPHKIIDEMSKQRMPLILVQVDQVLFLSIENATVTELCWRGRDKKSFDKKILLFLLILLFGWLCVLFLLVGFSFLPCVGAHRPNRTQRHWVGREFIAATKQTNSRRKTC